MTERNVVLMPKWYTTTQVAQLLGFGLYKTKMLIATGELRSLKLSQVRSSSQRPPRARADHLPCGR
jgi:hypothetical protein